MPKKAKNKKKRGTFAGAVPRRTIKGRGGLREIWNGFKDWTHGSGKPWMNAGRGLLDMFFPGAGIAVKGLTDIAGLGAYRGARNTTMLASPVPFVHAMQDNGVRIAHHEFLRDISSSTAFNLIRLGINPGVSTVFPWLSNVAVNFQKYEMKGLIFYFKSTSASALNSTNTALGVVVGGIQYNLYEAPPIDKTGILNISGAVDAKPCESMVIPVEVDNVHRMFKNLYVRSTSVTDDLAKYDVGNLCLATVGSQASAVIGELHVCYDIVLRQPIPGGVASLVPTAKLTFTGVDNTHPMGTAMTKVYDNVGIVFDASTHKITLPVGSSKYYLFNFIYAGGNAALTAPVLNTTNFSAVYNSQTPANGVTTGSYALISHLSVTDNTQTASVYFGVAGTLPTAPTLTVYVTNLSSLAVSSSHWVPPVIEYEAKQTTVSVAEPSDDEDEGQLVRVETKPTKKK